ncbi:uncharacterized protein Z519_07661 [Cladophialophora bantiana CBS 173.52]|uniref:Major facilitator superfamily (MFS) profile domain-containing protein n=1 Tax=Cladophialophora bantiana (strain ATCC 10958 / CBS 173.52 / CDC B-1940 / NIH 8579) TaxID=1442370 RepID=A0A0D2HEH3_CLAB1|nr:uncharacterized protein Z519_07661 [Cladophialophora bantiana CBS 173.52]KIW91693.1 hypothetical protein Z519_07661 [Cladophialophora bantiana CBS 173.52]
MATERPSKEFPAVTHMDAVQITGLGASGESFEVIHQRNIKVIGDTIEAMGMGRYQWRVWLTCGFGFAVEQLLLVFIGLVLPQIVHEFKTPNANYAVIALYIGLLVGAMACGFLVDIFGRRLIWILTLIVTGIMTMICAAAPNFTALCVFISIQALVGGGNSAIDLTVLIEVLPKKNRYLMPILACGWGLGSALGGLFAWPLIGNYSCPPTSTPATCSRSENMGWRYQYILIGGFCLILSVIRFYVSRLEESPRWLTAKGRLDDVVAVINELARVNKSSVTMDRELLQEEPKHEATSGGIVKKVLPSQHLRGIFANPKLARSTASICFMWAAIGIAYPIYTLFLPVYLTAHGAKLGDGSTKTTYRDYTIAATVGILGPFLSGYLVQIPLLGRRRSMAITACCAATFAIAFTTVRNEAQNVAFPSMINFWQNAYYGILYSYTPEVMPLSHRGTGCGLAMACGRLASISSPLIATYADTSTSAPIWVCCALYFAMAAVALTLPFEPEHYDREEAQMDQEMVN